MYPGVSAFTVDRNYVEEYLQEGHTEHPSGQKALAGRGGRTSRGVSTLAFLQCSIFTGLLE